MSVARCRRWPNRRWRRQSSGLNLDTVTPRRFLVVAVVGLVVAAACLVVGDLRDWPGLSVAGTVVIAFVVFARAWLIWRWPR